VDTTTVRHSAASLKAHLCRLVHWGRSGVAAAPSSSAAAATATASPAPATHVARGTPTTTASTEATPPVVSPLDAVEHIAAAAAATATYRNNAPPLSAL
jgi:hypothetical protein